MVVSEPSKEAVKAVAKRCGLPERTVNELLKSGWAYFERIDRSPYWERAVPGVNVPYSMKKS